MDEYVNKQWMGLEQLQSSYRQTFAEKEKAIEQGESLLRAEQGQNSQLRNQNRALLQRLNNLRESNQSSVGHSSCQHDA